MMWFFAALIVLAMAGVGLLAAGRGTPLAPAYDDRPDALVPAAGPLGAEDLRSVRFSLALRGYRMSEVDALLTRLASELERRDAQATQATETAMEPTGGKTTAADVEAGPTDSEADLSAPSATNDSDSA